MLSWAIPCGGCLFGDNMLIKILEIMKRERTYLKDEFRCFYVGIKLVRNKYYGGIDEKILRNL